MKPHPSRGRLRALIHYNPMTGVFTWRQRPEAPDRWNKRYADKIAGCHDKDGYRLIGVDGRVYFAHRLAYIYMFGLAPEEVDHVNHIRDDNRICNLRAADHTKNMRNQSISAANTSGVTGVHLHTQSGKWRARLKVNGKYISLGLYGTVDEAARVRRQAQNDFGFHENHGAAA